MTNQPKNNRTTLKDTEWMLSSASQEFLDKATHVFANTKDVFSLTQKLRGELTPERTHLVVEQIQLRLRAAGKFKLAQEMFFSNIGLQQSSGDLLADYKANRFKTQTQIADLCCGIGGDAMSLAKKNDVTILDSSEQTLALASHNVNLTAISEVNKIHGTVESIDVQNFDCWHIDPDQRVAGRRDRELDSLSPSLQQIEKMLKQNPNACIKLSPMVSSSDLPAWTSDAEWEWIGDRRECKQLLLWFGNLKTDSFRRANDCRCNKRGNHKRIRVYCNKRRIPINRLIPVNTSKGSSTNRMQQYWLATWWM